MYFLLLANLNLLPSLPLTLSSYYLPLCLSPSHNFITYFLPFFSPPILSLFSSSYFHLTLTFFSFFTPFFSYYAIIPFFRISFTLLNSPSPSMLLFLASFSPFFLYHFISLSHSSLFCFRFNSYHQNHQFHFAFSFTSILFPSI